MKRSKNQLRREKAKQQKLAPEAVKANEATGKATADNSVAHDEVVNEVETVEEVRSEKDVKEVLPPSDLLELFKDVFSRFTQEQESQEEVKPSSEPQVVYSDSSDESGSETEEPLTRKQARLQNKIPLSLLKAATSQPQLVDWFDADAKDPYLLVALKSQVNVIQVPAHWSAKRDYLSSRKGGDKPPFQLPQFIKDTGIEEMRSVATDDQTLKQLQRDKVQVKTGKLDIDYQKLHNAFYKYQTKPRVSGFGELYYEGKEMDEFTDELDHVKPGIVSSRLRKALGMPENDMNIPPPWLLIMQQLGKPSAYKSLVIPGLDSDYSNDGYREKNLKKIKITNREYWGEFKEYDESEEESESEEDVPEEIEQEEEVDQPVKVPIAEVGKRTFKGASKSEAETTDDAEKSLYTVLKENNDDSTKLAYDLSKNAKEPEQKEVAEPPKVNTVEREFKF